MFCTLSNKFFNPEARVGSPDRSKNKTTKIMYFLPYTEILYTFTNANNPIFPSAYLHAYYKAIHYTPVF